MQESRFFFCINLFEIRNQYLLEDIAKYGKQIYYQKSILKREYRKKIFLFFKNRVIIEHIFCYNNIYTRKTESEASSGHE